MASLGLAGLPPPWPAAQPRSSPLPLDDDTPPTAFVAQRGGDLARPGHGDRAEPLPGARRARQDDQPGDRVDPRDPDSRQRRPRADRARRRADRAPSCRRVMRLLLVEDDPNSARVARGAARDRRATPSIAPRTGARASTTRSEYPIDLAIVDLGLPTLSGVELIKRLRADGKAYPILVLTARDRWQDKVEALKLGADDYVVKPFHVEELLARVDALLRRAGGWAQSELVCGPIVLDTRTQEVRVKDAEARAHELRVQAARIPDAACGRGAVEDADHRGAVRRGLRARQQRDRGVHRAAAAQARSGFRVQADRDAARPRLPSRACARRTPDPPIRAAPTHGARPLPSCARRPVGQRRARRAVRRRRSSASTSRFSSSTSRLAATSCSTCRRSGSSRSPSPTPAASSRCRPMRSIRSSRSRTRASTARCSTATVARLWQSLSLLGRDFPADELPCPRRAALPEASTCRAFRRSRCC